MVVVINPSEGKPSMGKSIRNLSTVTRVGLDLAKRVFQVHAVDAKGEIVVARKLTRSQLIPFFAELAPCVVAMEACSSAHHWGRALIVLGHEVRLLRPAHVKPYVRWVEDNDHLGTRHQCRAACTLLSSNRGGEKSSASKPGGLAFANPNAATSSG